MMGSRKIADESNESRQKAACDKNLGSTLFNQWAECTTAHGFLDLTRAETLFGKLIWIILIALSLVIMGYQVFGVIREFSHNEWASTIKEVPSDTGKLYMISFLKLFSVVSLSGLLFTD